MRTFTKDIIYTHTLHRHTQTYTLKFGDMGQQLDYRLLIFWTLKKEVECARKWNKLWKCKEAYISSYRMVSASIVASSKGLLAFI
jgi:hypothetical protein